MCFLWVGLLWVGLLWVERCGRRGKCEKCEKCEMCGRREGCGNIRSHAVLQCEMMTR